MEKLSLALTATIQWCASNMATFTFQDLSNFEPPRKALSDEEIDVIGFNLNYPFSIRKIARAIEVAHGIVQESSEQTNQETSRENS
jgi:hypothetical protein